MAETKIADVIVPEVFIPYVIERTTQKSEAIKSGIIAMDPEFDRLANEGGNIVQMPFWQDLTGDDEVLSDSTPLSVGKIDSEKDAARKHQRGKAFGANDLAKFLSGDDPLAAIAGLVGDYRERRLQAMFLSCLTGIFLDSTMAANLLALHKTSGSPDASNMLNGSTFIDATQLFGDNKGKLTAVMMHSAVEAHLLKQDLIDYVPDSDGETMLTMFQGKRVVVDDTLAPTTVDGKPVYPTYLFGEGAFALGFSDYDEPVEGGFGTWQLEYSRTALQGSTTLINRWRNILHPRGVRWSDGSVAGVSPTNAELALAANWERVYEPKNVRIVKVTHNIAL